MSLMSIHFRPSLPTKLMSNYAGIGRKALPINYLRFNPLFPSFYSLKLHQFRQIGNLKTGNKEMSEKEKAFGRYLEETLVKRAKDKPRGKILSFEEYLNKYLGVLEQYRERSDIKELYGDDIEKIKRSYEGYVWSGYNRYKDSFEGGNPTTMV